MKNDAWHGITGISLKKIGKKFRGRWIFRNLDFEIAQGDKIAVTGSNGSGKSTFIQLISGYSIPSEGTMNWLNGQQQVPAELVYRQLSFAAPYMDLVEEFTLEENIRFYVKRKPLKDGLTPDELIDRAMLQNARMLPVRSFSSGMKQRLKLALAVYTWYRSMVSEIGTGRTVVICSNQVREETWFCDRTLNIEDYK
jgi:ABC-type multidrug transport system ATPase subunit